jgi:hypothetical protein
MESLLTTEQKVATLAAVLSRNTSQIKNDRAIEIAELAEIECKRKVEDLERELKQLERRKKSLTDLSPDNTFSIMKVKDFDPVEFIAKYNQIGLEIREATIKLEVARNTYKELFEQN